MSQQKIIIGIVAGEASGDTLASGLMAAIRLARPEVEFVGIGGPKMQSVGMKVLYPMEKLAVFGYVEVLRHYREIISIRSRLRAHFLANPPALFIGVDAPDFNLDLEMALKRRGIATIHYVSPSIWAWRAERIVKIKRAVSHMLALFPHEPKIYQAAGVPVEYVGHPLADMLPETPNRDAMRETMRIPVHATVFAFLPGSRQSEVRMLARLYIDTARLVLEQHPDARFLVPLASRETRTIFEQALYDANADDLPFFLLFGHAQDAMVAADAVLVASGTATLECALLKRPMVITYRLNPLTWRMMKRKSYLPYFGLPNILCGRFVVPELIQQDATAENLAQALLNLLNDKDAVAQLERTFTELHRTLRQDTAQKAAAVVMRYLPAA